MDKVYTRDVILTDIDGVLLDWVGAFQMYLKTLGIKTLTSEPQNWSLYDFVPNANELIKQFNTSYGFRDLPAFSDAQIVLPELKKLGFDIIGITACSDHPYTKAMRAHNISTHFDSTLSDLICLPLGADKLELLKTYGPSIWIEDNPKAAIAGIEAGHETFLIERNYNKNFQHPELYLAKSWHEIYDQLVKKYS